MPDLIDVLGQLAKPKKETRLAKVTATNPFKVTFHDSATAVAIPRLDTYTPAINDMVLVVGSSRVAVGKVIPADTTNAQNVPTRSY
jgi:hypothetical protein